MTEPDRKFEEEIRRALCAASDLIVPAGDGLNLIRERAARRPLVPRWLLAYATHLPRQLVRAGTVAASEVAATTRGHSSLRLMLSSARRWPGKAHRGLRTPSLWLRPALATATALLLVIAVTLSIPRLRATVGAQLDSAFGSNSGQGPGGGSAGAGLPGSEQSTGATPMGSGTATLVPGKPFLATMPPPGAQCRAHGTGGTDGTATRYVPPSLGPAVSQTIGAGTNAGVTKSATCYPTTAPAKVNRATSLPPPVTTPVAPPTSTAPTTPPPTSTAPTTPPPTSTAPTTPPDTPTPTDTPTDTPTSPDSSTSSADSTASTGTPTETPDAGN